MFSIINALGLKKFSVVYFNGILLRIGLGSETHLLF